ncbi:hypothetical protein BCON_0012g00750 [Botryotinia convoluta]|uniref:Uncharacterized protein n=1 Tax=Botryotinia convoluta TaxID=54673 RepID=A0A4Z1IQG1_9HELO|nr:hypothetical protein BCON_0012g00750 [Botryotinia convoluta]
MHLQKFLVVISSLTVVGLSAPVASQERNFEIAECDEPNAIILARHGSETDAHYILTITEKDAVKVRALGPRNIDSPNKIFVATIITNQNKRADKTIERALSRKNIDEPPEIIIPTLVTHQNKRGDETVVWVPPPPTSKIPLAREDATVVWVQPPPTPKIPM